MSDLSCDEMEERGTIARYVAGRLDDATSAAFEDHFLTCARCQASLRAGVVARESGGLHREARRRARVWLYGGAAGLAAASLAAVILLQGTGERALATLGQVEVAPIYLGAPVRAFEPPEVALFDSAMWLYGAQRYEEAAATLERAQRAGAEDAAVSFFLGASRLMADAPATAEAAFSAVIGEGRNLYVGEAYFYRAKARLQQGDRKGAIGDLRRAVTIESATSESARQLLQQLEA